MAKKIEVFSARCGTCKETIEMVRSVPAVVIDGKLAGCCAGRGPDEHIVRAALK